MKSIKLGFALVLLVTLYIQPTEAIVLGFITGNDYQGMSDSEKSV